MDGRLGGAEEKTRALMPNAVFIGEFALAKPTADKAATVKKIAAWCSTLKEAKI